MKSFSVLKSIVNDVESNEKLFTQQHKKSTKRMENCWWHLICGETATDIQVFKVQAHESAVFAMATHERDVYKQILL